MGWVECPTVYIIGLSIVSAIYEFQGFHKIPRRGVFYAGGLRIFVLNSREKHLFQATLSTGNILINTRDECENYVTFLKNYVIFRNYFVLTFFFKTG
jgi:hypothetical protein